MIASLDFAPVDARYLRVFAIGGDNFYSVSEIQAFAAPVPEPSTIMLFGLGLLTLMGANYRRQKVMNQPFNQGDLKEGLHAE